MIRQDVKVGSFVQFDDEGGSIGKVIAQHPNVKDFFYVEWTFGLDAKGERMTSTAGVSGVDLFVIDEGDYRHKDESPCGWGES